MAHATTEGNKGAGFEGAAFLAAIVASSSDSIIGKTLDGTIVSWNQGAERLYGYMAAEAIGRSMALVVPPDRADELEEILARLRRGERVEHFETARQCKDGTRVEVSVSISPVYDAQGAVVGAASIARDITERKRMEAVQGMLAAAGAVLSSSLDYETALNNTVRLMTPCLADWCMLDVIEEDGQVRRLAAAHADPDKAWLTSLLCRYPPALNWPDGVAPVLRSGRTQPIPAIDDALLQRAARNAEHLEVLRTLAPRCAIIVPLQSRGRVLGALTLVLAESGRRYTPADIALAEELGRRAGVAVDNARLFRAAEQQRSRLENVLDQIPEGVIIADAPDGRFSLWNRAALRDHTPMGADIREQWRNARPQRTGGTPYAFEELPLARALWRGETVLGAEMAFVEPSGRRAVFLLSAAPVVNGHGAIIAAVAVFQDITARKTLEQQREEFLSLAAHELKTPLTVIKGNSQLLLRGYARGRIALAAQDAQTLELLADRASRAAALVSDLLDLSRIGAGRLELHTERMELGEMLRSVAAQQQAMHPDRTLQLEGIETALGCWDRERLTQVLINLLDNALKYSSSDRPVTLRLSVTPDQRWAHLAVQDQGVGIPARDLPHLFDRYFRGSNVGMTPGGLGLGLYLSAQMVGRHGGRMWAESVEGSGSTFHVLLPLSAPEEAAA